MKRRKPRVDREFSADVRADGAERAGFRCERCKAAPIQQYHHKLLRAQGGTGTPDNLACLCSPCHVAIHTTDTAAAYEQGWLVRGAGRLAS